MAEVRPGIEPSTEAVEALIKVLKRPGAKLRSLCGVTPGNSTLDVPRRELNLVDSLLLAAELEANVWIEGINADQNVRSSCAKLMRKGGNTSMSWQDGWYPLIWAAKDGNCALVGMLLDRGMPIDLKEEEKNLSGFTALMWAASRGHLATVELLLRRGANPRVVERHNKTAAMLAEQRGFTAVRELLEEKAPDSIQDIAQRAISIKVAADKLRKLKDEKPDEVAEATTKIQAMTRGKSSRNILHDLAAQAKEKEAAPVPGWGAKQPHGRR